MAKCDDGTLEYLSYEIVKDYQDKPLILIHFNFTNSSEKSTSAQLVFHPTVFQNGVECSFGLYVGDNEAYGNLSKDIQSGVTLEVAFPYNLQDTENPVDLEVKALSDFLNDKVYKQTISLTK